MKKIDGKLLSALLVSSLFYLPFSAFAEEASSCLNTSTKTLNKQAELYQADIKKAAERYSVSPALIKAVIASDSCFNRFKVSPKGAIGLMQIRADTAKRFGALDPFSAEANIDAGTRYLSYLLKRYQGSLAEVSAAYLSDSGTLWQDGAAKTPFAEMREPVKQLLATLLKFENNKKAQRQAQDLLKQWGKSEQDYQTALLTLPYPDAKAAKAWFQSRLASVHYPRTPEARSCGGFNAKTLQTKAAPYEDLIQKAAKCHGVDPALIKSVIAAESCYREMVVSYRGASGLMQLMPETADELGVVDIFDPAENINAGTRYLSWLLKHYNGSFTHAIAAYNAGAGRIMPGAPVTISFAETRGYINTVLTHLTKLEKGKQSITNAQLLLAGWGQAELEYQAALRGETLAVAEPQADPLVDGALPLPVGQQPTLEAPALAGVNNAAQPSATEQPTLTLALLRNEKVSLLAAKADVQPTAHLISAIDQDIVRVKRVSATTVSPAELLPAKTPASIIPVAAVEEPVTAVQVPATAAAGNSLPNCEALPQSLLAQTEQRGSGRYGAFFYFAQAGDTVDLIAEKVGVSPQDIMRLNNVSPEGTLPADSQLKVAECSRRL